MVVTADVDITDRPAVVSICHTDSRGWTPTVAYCWGSLGAVCVCFCIVECECVRGGGLEAKINGAVFGSIPEKHLHQSRSFFPLFSSAPVCVCVCVCAWVCVNACIRVACVCSRQERLSAQKHFLIISSQFLHFLSTCVCPAVCLHCIQDAAFAASIVVSQT